MATVTVKVEVPLYQDPFRPVLKSGTPSLNMSDEQKHYIREVLDLCCSDSRFAQKAYDALAYILNSGQQVIPTVASLVPSTVVLGSPSFDLHVVGTNFSPDTVIVFNGYDEPTTHISSTELTTGINMPLWQAPAVVPVLVRNIDGSMSTPKMFSFTAVTVLLASPGATPVTKK